MKIKYNEKIKKRRDIEETVKQLTLRKENKLKEKEKAMKRKTELLNELEKVKREKDKKMEEFKILQEEKYNIEKNLE